MSEAAPIPADDTRQYHPQLAGKGRRFLTFLIDYAAYLALSFVIGIVAALIWGDAASAMFEGLKAYLSGALVLLAYYVVFEGTSGRTIGKLVMGTMVVDEQGGRPTLQQIIGRSAARLIPFEPFSVLLTDDARGWHDDLSKTYVVLVRGDPG